MAKAFALQPQLFPIPDHRVASLVRDSFERKSWIHRDKLERICSRDQWVESLSDWARPPNSENVTETQEFKAAQTQIKVLGLGNYC
jgi:hypothetical protein